MLAGAATAALLLPVSPAGAVRATPQRPDSGSAGTGLGIRILDVPAARVQDPRALSYIVDYLNPGTTIHRRLEINNDSPDPQHVELYAGAASVVDNTFTAADGRLGNDLSTWVSLDSASVDLAPGATRDILATIAIPSTASKGERYAAVWAQIAKAATAGNSVGQINRVGIRMYLDVGPGGEPPTDFEIGAMTVARGGGQWPVVTAQVHNTGGRALDMSGSLSMSNADGSVKAGPFKATTGVTILPGNTAPVNVALDKSLPDGTWNAQLTLTSGTVQRTRSGTFTLPVPGSAETVKPAALSRTMLALAIAAAVVLVALLLLLARYLIRRRRPPLGA